MRASARSRSIASAGVLRRSVAEPLARVSRDLLRTRELAREALDEIEHGAVLDQRLDLERARSPTSLRDRGGLLEIDERVAHALQPIARAARGRAARARGRPRRARQVAQRARPRLIGVERALLVEARARRASRTRAAAVARVAGRLGMARDALGDRRRCRAHARQCVERRAMEREPLVLVRRRVDAFLDERLAERCSRPRS